MDRFKHFDYSNCIFSVLNDAGEVVYANDSCAKLFGYDHRNDILNTTAYDIRTYAIESAPLFEEQNNYVLKQEEELNVIDIHRPGLGDIIINYTIKTPFYDDLTQKNYVIINSVIVEQYSLQRMLGSLAGCINTRYSRGQSTKVLSEKIHGLTEREEECLYFTLRGKTAKQIAQCIGISFRTVEDTIERIKHKFSCPSKGALIEFAFEQGFQNFVPAKLLTQFKHLSLKLS